MKSHLAFAFVALFAVAGCKKQPPEELGTSAVSVNPVDNQNTPQAVKEIIANFSKVFFDFNSADLDSDSLTALKENAGILLQATDVKVEIQGHADERGTTDYNLALGQKRADTVLRYLIAQGVDPARVSTISYGEEKPSDKRRSEVAWARNRRAEFRVTWGQATVKGTTD